MDRYESGLKNFKNICGESAINSLEELKTISPELASMVIEFAYGDLHTLTYLTPREMEIISITSLITQGEINSALELHYKAALNIGITSKEIKDIIVHSVAYIGFPKAIKAMMLLKEVLVKI